MIAATAVASYCAPIPMPRRQRRQAIPPTFPVPPAELARRRRALVLNSPLLWSLASISLATVLLIRHPMVVALVTGTCFTWLICLALRMRPSHIERSILNDWIRTSNARQDRELACHAARLHDEGRGDHARIVIDFLERKRRIESLLTESEASISSRMELENLVDQICLAIPKQMDQLLETEAQIEDDHRSPTAIMAADIREQLEKTRGIQLDRIKRAGDLLSRTQAELEMAIDPAIQARQVEDGDELENAIGKLEQELEISERTRCRLLEDCRRLLQPTRDLTPDVEPETGREH